MSDNLGPYLQMATLAKHIAACYLRSAPLSFDVYAAIGSSLQIASTPRIDRCVSMKEIVP